MYGSAGVINDEPTTEYLRYRMDDRDGGTHGEHPTRVPKTVQALVTKPGMSRGVVLRL